MFADKAQCFHEIIREGSFHMQAYFEVGLRPQAKIPEGTVFPNNSFFKERFHARFEREDKSFFRKMFFLISGW